MKKYLIIAISLFFLAGCKYSIEIKENLDTNSGVTLIENQNVSSSNSGVLENSDNSENITKNETGTGNIEILNGRYCVLDECIPAELEVKEEGGFFTALIESDESKEYEKVTYKLSIDYKIFEKRVEKVMQVHTYKVLKINDIYIKSISKQSCGGSTYNQKIYDKNGKELKNFIFDGYDKKVKIGNIDFFPSLVGGGGMFSIMEDYNDYKIFRGEDRKVKKYKSVEEFQKFIENDSLNKGKKVYKAYVAEFVDFPDVFFFYDSKNFDSSAIRVVWLGTDEKYIKENIAENGDYLDLNITNKIIGYYNDLKKSIALFDENGERIEKITQTKIPFFQMKKLNDKGNYLVYLKPGYELRSLAEMCKPVVYYYSDEKENNTLNLQPKKGDYFTKLIPDLNENNSWDFSSENGKIKVENEFYDYLYYSLMTTDYKHNENGWIVYGENINNFFQDKLTKINFNEKEKSDFIDYWKNEYKKDKYYFVSFKYKDELNKIIKLNFSKEIENEFRVLLDSYEILDYSDERYGDFLYKNVGDKFDKYLIQKFERNLNSREVFEWGGVLVRSDKTIIK